MSLISAFVFSQLLLFSLATEAVKRPDWSVSVEVSPDKSSLSLPDLWSKKTISCSANVNNYDHYYEAKIEFGLYASDILLASEKRDCFNSYCKQQFSFSVYDLMDKLRLNRTTENILSLLCVANVTINRDSSRSWGYGELKLLEGVKQYGRCVRDVECEAAYNLTCSGGYCDCKQDELHGMKYASYQNDWGDNICIPPKAYHESCTRSEECRATSYKLTCRSDPHTPWQPRYCDCDYYNYYWDRLSHDCVFKDDDCVYYYGSGAATVGVLTGSAFLVVLILAAGVALCRKICSTKASRPAPVRQQVTEQPAPPLNVCSRVIPVHYLWNSWGTEKSLPKTEGIEYPNLPTTNSA